MLLVVINISHFGMDPEDAPGSTLPSDNRAANYMPNVVGKKRTDCVL